MKRGVSLIPSYDAKQTIKRISDYVGLCLLRPPYLYSARAQGGGRLSPGTIEGWLHDVSVLHLHTPLREYGTGADAHTSRQADAPRGGRSRDYDDYRQAVRYDGAFLFTPPRHPADIIHTSGDAVTAASKKLPNKGKARGYPRAFLFLFLSLSN